MDLVTVTVDGKKVEVPEGSTVLEAASKAGIEIPTLCHHPDLEARAGCRVCVVDIEGEQLLQASCVYPVADGMKVNTRTPDVRRARKMAVELLLSSHPEECLECPRNQNCELQALAEQLGIREVRFNSRTRGRSRDQSTASLVRDPDRCIVCHRCVHVCQEIQGAGVLYPNQRGVDTLISPTHNHQLADVSCVLCGQCANVCPVGAIYEKDDTERVWSALDDPDMHVVVQTAPAVRVSIGEELDTEKGALVTGKMVAALRRLGFDRVFDTDFTADLTILEEGHEFLERLENGGTLPLLTSCSPGWIKFIEHNYPDLLDNLSTCKSPQQMFGALAKTYYPQSEGIDPENVFVVSIMPCTAKKFEASRPEMNDSGQTDVDVVLTTRELGRMLRESGIDFAELPEEDYDDPLGISTGAALIFGATGGVMEAALRTVYEVVTGDELKDLDFEDVRGLKGIKEAAVEVDGIEVKVAVAHSLGQAKKLMDRIRAGEADYHFIEIMCCPGGCIGGGGQPIPTTDAIRQQRIDSIYRGDRELPLRKSHENPAVKTLYEEFLGKPLGEKSHHLLHTEYTPRKKYR